MSEQQANLADPAAAALLPSLKRMGLVGPAETPRFEPLAGGVSSDIWRVELSGGPICVKRALPKLKVKADWRVPVERNANEVGWMERADRIVPGSVPELLGHDREAGLFAMAYLNPATHPVWKDELRAGRADPAFAAIVGDRLGRIHAATAHDPDIAARFASDPIFHAIRLEPFLEASARAHPDLAPVLRGILKTTAKSRLVMVHGDISPKNILVGPDGPVFLDAECAWYGDPAFDVAFCLNHLLLKCLWVPGRADSFLACFEAFAEAHLACCGWERPEALEKRTARLLPGLFLARADGKSPAEYLTEDDKARVRKMAARWLREPVDRLSEIHSAWGAEVGA